MFDRIACVYVGIRAKGHFVMSIIKGLNVIVASLSYSLTWVSR